MTIMRHLTAGLVSAIALAGLTASAFAAPPVAPPGQEKQAEQADPAAAAPQAAPSADHGTATAPGQLKADASTPASPPGEQAKAAKADAKTTGINATTAGVKPSSTTEKWTSTTAGASPDVSKRYGNGTTAAQIATARGAPAGTEIRGPGNSQPHKVCGKNGNWVDVHAVKSYANVCANATRAPTPPAAAPKGAPTAAVAQASPTSVGAAAGLAVTTTPSAPAGGSAAQPDAGGVAGALDVVGETAGGSLPFTGIALWSALLAGIAALALGWALRRAVRQPA